MSDPDGGEPHDGVAQRNAADDAAAVSVAYERHHTRIFGTVYRLLGDAATAADVTHDAFVRAWEAAPRFRGDSSFGTWITRIAINLALRHMRRERWLAAFRRREAAEPRLARPVSLEAMELDRAIRALPEPLRAPFVLHALEGYSHAEAALILGISEAACRQRLHRARVRLAEALAEEER